MKNSWIIIFIIFLFTKERGLDAKSHTFPIKGDEFKVKYKPSIKKNTLALNKVSNSSFPMLIVIWVLILVLKIPFLLLSLFL
jgi:hypothetical protein